jgi:hypothetical protein
MAVAWIYLDDSQRMEIRGWLLRIPILQIKSS